MKAENIFGNEFYPTPREVVERMLVGYNVSGKVILEPSAGSGNIVDVLMEHGAKEVLACEINTKLRRTLSGKCRLIGEDFLKVSSEQVSHVDMIVMNPPFSNAQEHILHAYDIAPSGCDIVTLCNHDSFIGRTSVGYKQLREIVYKNGSEESFGNCFGESERQTFVEVGCVQLHKYGKEQEEWSGFFMNEDEEEQYLGQQGPGLLPYNFVRDVVGRYIEAVNSFDSVMEASQRINDLTNFVGSKSIIFGASWMDRNKYCQSKITREIYRKELQKDSWRAIFRKFDMNKYLTAELREQMNRFVEKQVEVPFTMKNIYTMINMIVQTHGQRMEQSLGTAFDHICSFSADNNTAGEKWRTNANYMINKKFIVPGVGSYRDYDTSGCVDITYSDYSLSRLEDCMKALCYMTGIEYDEKTMSIRRYFWDHRIPWGTWTEMPFFKIKVYKKGTAHFQFLDDKVWMEFNRRVAKLRGWQLPDNVRTGKYTSTKTKAKTA